jgi:hypothetical protein
MKRPTKLLQKAINVLLAEAEPVLPVVVLFEVIDDCHAYVDVVKGKFHLVIDERLSSSIAKHFLVHEWAHCIVWAEGPLIRDHGDAWALTHGRLYRRLFDTDG